MNTRIFRKAALDRLSSPEDLDRVLTITDGRHWLVLLGLLIVVVTALVWSLLARVPTMAGGQGVLIGQGGVVNVVTTGAGVITDFHVKVGDHVKAGDIIGTIAQPELVTALLQAKSRLAEARVDTSRVTHVGNEASRLQLDALNGQEATVQGDIKRGEELARLAQEQIPVEQRLLEKGLSTRQQVIDAQQKYIAIEADVEKQKAQLVSIKAQRFALQENPEQTRLDALAKADELQRQVQILEQQIQTSGRVRSPFAGEVVELKVYEGESIVTGAPVVSLQPAIDQLGVVAYIPTSEAKSITPGMLVQVSPSTIRREEYGFMRGTVTSVSDFPTTTTAAMRTLENDTLVSALKANQVVNEVRVTILPGKGAGGFLWSSDRHMSQTLSSGTLCSVQVTTEERRPIELVLPFLKSFFNPS